MTLTMIVHNQDKSNNGFMLKTENPPTYDNFKICEEIFNKKKLKNGVYLIDTLTKKVVSK